MARAGWAVTDQALSSLTNFALTFLAARYLDPHSFGGLSVAFVAYLFVLGITRAITSEPLAVRVVGADQIVWRSAVRGAAATALCVGILAGIAALGAGAAWGGPGGRSLAVIGVFMPGLLVQDVWRFAFFAAGRGAIAAANDAVWAVGMGISLLVTRPWDQASAPAFALIWGACGTIGGFLGVLQTGVVPRVRDAKWWLEHHRDLARHFSGEFLLLSGGAQAALSLVAILAGVEAVAGIRAASHVLFGPHNLVFTGALLFAIPEAAQQAQVGNVKGVQRVGLYLSGLLLVTALACGVVASAVPSNLGNAILGQNWAVATSFLLPVTVLMAATGVAGGGAVVLRGLRESGKALQSAAFHSGLTVAAAALGAGVWGGMGAAWALAGAAIVASTCWWVFALSSLRGAWRCAVRPPDACCARS